MFERFTKKARQVVVTAQEQARERRADAVRTEHLLAALYAVPDGLAVRVLTALGVTREDVDAEIDRLTDSGPSDADALATLGIDLDEVRRQVEDAFGPGALDRTRAGQKGRFSGHIPFDRATKKVLELSLREAIRMGHNYIGTEHLLLGLLHTETGAAHHILVGLMRTDAAPGLGRGVCLDAARVIVEEFVRGRRAG